MRRSLVVLVLVATPALAQSYPSDAPLVAPDKLLHFTISAGAAGVATGLAVPALRALKLPLYWAPVAGAVVGCIPGGIKEGVWDCAMKRGTCDGGDMVANACGCVAGALAQWGILHLVRGM